VPIFTFKSNISSLDEERICMHCDVRRLAFCAFVPIGLLACQNEPPAFVEQALVPITLTVTESGGDDGDRGNEFMIENESEGDVLTADAGRDGLVMGYSGFMEEDGEAEEADVTDENEIVDENENAEEPKQKPAAHDASAAKETAVASDNAASVAAACGRHLKGFASKVLVISAEDALSSLNIGPDTALAIRLSGNRASLSLTLGVGQPLAGICFVMRGHESFAQLTTASDVKKLVYLAAGDESKGDIQLNGAALGEARIELTGHAPSLNLQGVDSEVCSGALLKNKSARVQCSP
jgi:hypothetical protein